jgi:repressor LexA
MDELTPIQREVLESLRRHADLGDAPPTYRDLCQEFGWSSTGTARDHLRALARKGCLELSGGRARLLRLSNVAPVVRVPLLGHIVAGLPVPAEELVEGQVPVPAEWVGSGSAFALRVHGQSMVGAGIQDGDVVVVRKQSTAKDGDVVAATVDGETTLKRLYRRSGRVRLVAENPSYPDLEVRSEDLVVHGIAVGLLRRLAGAARTKPRSSTASTAREE